MSRVRFEWSAGNTCVGPLELPSARATGLACASGSMVNVRETAGDTSRVRSEQSAGNDDRGRVEGYSSGAAELANVSNSVVTVWGAGDAIKVWLGPPALNSRRGPAVCSSAAAPLAQVSAGTVTVRETGDTSHVWFELSAGSAGLGPAEGSSADAASLTSVSGGMITARETIATSPPRESATASRRHNCLPVSGQSGPLDRIEQASCLRRAGTFPSAARIGRNCFPPVSGQSKGRATRSRRPRGNRVGSRSRCLTASKVALVYRASFLWRCDRKSSRASRIAGRG
jgi:hypothetical protein